VYYATGGLGGNHPIIVNDNDVVLVDDGTTPATARDLLEDMKLITTKPIRYVVNTHFHYDHTDGNQIFGPDVQIVGHEYLGNAIRTRDILNSEPFQTFQTGRVAAVDSLTKQIASEKDAAKKTDLQKQLAAAQLLVEQLKEVKPTPPNVTYTSKMILHEGPREIQFLFLGRGHTGGDTFVYLPKERIICTGDMMETQPAYMGNAFFDEWIATLGALKEMDFAIALPGHGHPFTDKALITAFQDYLKDVTTQVAALRKQGLSPEEAAQKVDLTAHAKDFPQITGPGAEIRGIRRIYEWLDHKAN
jgi:glyoxylase-like metal-dependent hydrolase (beta-lactamase superfamily II)